MTHDDLTKQLQKDLKDCNFAPYSDSRCLLSALIWLSEDIRELEKRIHRLEENLKIKFNIT